MEANMSPIRVPLEIPYKYHNPLRFLLLLFAWSLPAYGLIAMNPLESALFVFTVIWTLCLLAVLILPLYYDLVFFPEGIQIRFFGRVIQQIPISDMKLLCGVGNDFALYLCLSKRDVEELAQYQEEKYQKGYFTRHELPFYKQKHGWQARFANDYLLKPAWNILNLHTHTPMLWLPFDPVVITYLRRLYPQLPLVQLCRYRSVQSFMDSQDRIPYYTERFHIDEKGVHIIGTFSKEERRLFPAERIKTVFRVDRFVPLSKGEPTYTSYLVVSELSVPELAQRGKQKKRAKWKKQLIAELPEAEEMYAAEFHFSALVTWSWRKSTECHFLNTPETEAKLRHFFPHARWVDYSKEWM